MDISILDTLPYIDQEDLDLWLRPTQDDQRLVRPTRQRLQPVGFTPRTETPQLRIRRPRVRRKLGDARLQTEEPQVIHPPGYAVGDPKLSRRIGDLARPDIQVKPVVQGEIAVPVRVFRRHGAVVALGSRVEFVALDVAAWFEVP